MQTIFTVHPDTDPEQTIATAYGVYANIDDATDGAEMCMNHMLVHHGILTAAVIRVWRRQNATMN